MISTSNLIKNRILIIGSNGMLGQRLVDYYNRYTIELLCASAEEESFVDDVDYLQIDISNKKEVRKVIKEFYPDFIINAAAYTNVDGCETEKELAWKINVNGPEYLAYYANTIDAFLIHISSDYVFNGKAGPYSEEDMVDPISYYGKTKLAGENVLFKSGCRYTVVRTNVLYGPVKYGRPDFVKWVITALRAGEEIRIVDDQINNPMFIDDLVSGISKIVDTKKVGIYNLGGKVFLNRFEFTLKIADFFNLDKNLIKRIKTHELNQPARRPLTSGLITLKAETELNFRPHDIYDTFVIIEKELNL